MSNGDYILPVCIKLVSLHSSCDLHHKKISDPAYDFSDLIYRDY